MYSVDISNAHELLRYHDLFRGDLPEIETEISKLNVNKAISIICELIAVRLRKLTTNVFGIECRIPLETALKQLIGIDPFAEGGDCAKSILHKEKHIISLQCLLILLKYVIVHGNLQTLSDIDYQITDADYIQIIKLNLIIAEKLDKSFSDEDIDMSHFVYGNYHVNYNRNVANAFLRSFYMLEIISRDKENFEEDAKEEYRNYYDDFINQYHYTPTEYLSFLFWELSAYYSDNPKLSYCSIWRNIDSSYNNAPQKETALQIIRDLMKTPDCYYDWARQTKDSHWDFSDFSAYPFLSDAEQSYISISDYTLRNCFFEKLFWMIRNCYSVDDSRCMAFYGRLFEKYVQTLSENAVDQNDELTYIPEFTASNKKSSDAYIRKGKSLLAVEMKGYSILQDTLTKNESIDRNIEKLFIKPVLQADKAFNYFDNRGGYFDGIDEVYIISVTMDSVNAVPAYLESAYKQIEDKKKSIKVKYVFNLCIEEYEMLMYLVEKGFDIFQLLAAYYSKAQLLPFSSFLHDQINEPIEMTSFMRDMYTHACTYMKKCHGIE